MKEKIALTSNIILIGIVWIYTGTVFIFSNVIKTLERSKFLLSYEFNLNSIISILAIIIGTFFISGKKWAYIATFTLSLCLIVGIWGIAFKLIIYGVSDILKFQTPGSYTTFAFGLIVLLSSLPFIFVIANLRNYNNKQHWK